MPFLISNFVSKLSGTMNTTLMMASSRVQCTIDISARTYEHLRRKRRGAARLRSQQPRPFGAPFGRRRGSKSVGKATSAREGKAEGGVAGREVIASAACCGVRRLREPGKEQRRPSPIKRLTTNGRYSFRIRSHPSSWMCSVGWAAFWQARQGAEEGLFSAG